jgi:hypothetical protein
MPSIASEGIHVTAVTDFSILIPTLLIGFRESLPLSRIGLEFGGYSRAKDVEWSGTDPMTFTYQWQGCDGAGANCASRASCARGRSSRAASA